ncbi:unnamed protein product [Symbiodinium sp. KB8]|nr:unnamed protein product [Symbiodinium sp. KB8]
MIGHQVAGVFERLASNKNAGRILAGTGVYGSSPCPAPQHLAGCITSRSGSEMDTQLLTNQPARLHLLQVASCTAACHDLRWSRRMPAFPLQGLFEDGLAGALEVARMVAERSSYLYFNLETTGMFAMEAGCHRSLNASCKPMDVETAALTGCASSLPRERTCVSSADVIDMAAWQQWARVADLGRLFSSESVVLTEPEALFGVDIRLCKPVLRVLLRQLADRRGQMLEGFVCVLSDASAIIVISTLKTLDASCLRRRYFMRQLVSVLVNGTHADAQAAAELGTKWPL